MAKDKTRFRRQQNDQGPRGQTRGLQVHRSARHLAAFHHHPDRVQRGDLHRGPRVRRLQHPRLEEHQRLRHARHARSDHGVDRSLQCRADAQSHLHHRRSDHTRAVRSRSARHRRKGEAYLQSTGIADTASSGRKRSSSSSTKCAYSYTSNSSFYLVDCAEGHLEQRARRIPEPRLQDSRTRKATSRSRPPTPSRTSAPRCASRWRKLGIPIERQHHEVATAGQAEIDIRFAPMKQMADDMMIYKYIVENVAQEARQDRHASCPSRSSATTAPACTPTCRSGRKASRSSPGNEYAGLSEMALFFIGGILEARPRAHLHLQPDDQQLQAPRARVTRRR